MDKALSAVISTLTIAQNASAVTFAGFVVIHLSAPIVGGTLRGERGASGWMLIGRELYQGAWTERVLVYGSVIVHVCSGVLRRAALALQASSRSRRRQARDRAQAAKDDGSPRPDAKDSLTTDSATRSTLWPRLSLHSITGYLLIPPLVHHLSLHRLIPAAIGIDISYGFPAYGLTIGSSLRRGLSAAAYAALTGLATWHALVGIRSISTGRRVQSLKRSSGGSAGTGSWNPWRTSCASVLAGVGLGVVRIVATSGEQPAWVARGWERVLRHGWAELR